MEQVLSQWQPRQGWKLEAERSHTTWAELYTRCDPLEQPNSGRENETNFLMARGARPLIRCARCDHMGQGRELRRQKAPGHKNVRQSDQKILGFLPGGRISSFGKKAWPWGSRGDNTWESFTKQG